MLLVMMIQSLGLFFIFILPGFEYWYSGSIFCLKLLDCALGSIHVLLPNLSVDLDDRNKMASWLLLYKILNIIDHPLYCKLLKFAMPTLTTQKTSQQNERTFVLLRHNYYSILKMLFFNLTTKLLNSLPNNILRFQPISF